MKSTVRRTKNLQGFTLIEMVVSISMIALTAALFIANYHSSIRQTDLTMTAQKLVSDIHAAQNNTLGLIKYNGLVPAGGWGIHFNNLDSAQNGYVLYADLEAPGQSGYMQYDPATEGQVDYGARVTNLSNDIKIIDLAGGAVDATWADVTFLPPDPQTNISLGEATSTDLAIVLKSINNNTCRTVTVNFLGLVEVLDATTCP